MNSLMGLQITFLHECFVTIAARESCGMSLHGCTTECEIRTEMKILILTTLQFSIHSEQQPNTENVVQGT